MRFLLDADILIDIEKGLEDLPEGELYISIITLYEFIREEKTMRKRRSILKKYLP